MNKTRKLMIIVASLIVATTLVSAATIQYFGSVHTTLNIQQSIAIGEKTPQGITWHNWDAPVNRVIGNESKPMVFCTDYCYKLLIKNNACVDADVWFNETPVPQDVTITHHVFGGNQTVRLIWKTPDWQLDQQKADSYVDVTFNTCGETFDYTLVPHNLQGAYSLIYYFDKDPRFTNWGHCLILDNIIFNGTTAPISGNANVQTMPYKTDANADNSLYNYTTIDGYEHANGAKLWLVPTTYGIDGNFETEPIALQENKLIAFNQPTYLFETDLFLYIDCSNWNPYCLPDVYPIFDQHIAGGKFLLKAQSQYCWITCYHLNFDVTGSQQVFDTFVHGQKHVAI